MNGRTHQGMVRANNEDSIATLNNIGVAILADGMGGHQAGEVASSMAVEMVQQYLTEIINSDKIFNSDHILESIVLANTAVFELSQQHPEYTGMGTTIVVCGFVDGNIVTGHVGDSRLYCLRDHTLEQITQDHSVVQELVSRGFMSKEEANNSMNKNLVTKALGIDASIEPDINSQKIHDGDIYLLCSDGLSDVVTDAEIERIITEQPWDNETFTNKLIDQANSAGGPDNISVILISASG